MRVYPINNLNGKRSMISRQTNFKSHYPIPTNPYDVLAASAVFSAIVVGIYYLGSKIIDKIIKWPTQINDSEK